MSLLLLSHAPNITAIREGTSPHITDGDEEDPEDRVEVRRDTDVYSAVLVLFQFLLKFGPSVSNATEATFEMLSKVLVALPPLLVRDSGFPIWLSGMIAIRNI